MVLARLARPSSNRRGGCLRIFYRPVASAASRAAARLKAAERAAAQEGESGASKNTAASASHTKRQKNQGAAAATSSGSNTSSPFRRPVAWGDKRFYDESALEEEMRRVFDVCHGCRRCFNLCNSFPKLFELIDKAPNGEVDSLDAESFGSVADECTLCDMCFIEKCPYVPPHEFDIDFPKLMLRYRAVQHKWENAEAAEGRDDVSRSVTGEAARGGRRFLADPSTNRKLAVPPPESALERLLVDVDTVGPLATALPRATDTALANRAVRRVLKALVGVDVDARVPAYRKPNQSSKPVAKETRNAEILHARAPRRVALYSTCTGEYNGNGAVGAAAAVLERNGVHVEVVYPECCGMPQMEGGHLGDVAGRADRIAKALEPYLSQGFDVVSVTASCSLMLKQEWPLLLPENKLVQRLAASSHDIHEYLANIVKEPWWKPANPLSARAVLHFACHARALNTGHSARSLLATVPDLSVEAVVRCSGHGGSWGVKHTETAMKVGAPAISRAAKVSASAAENEQVFIASECPLAAKHIAHGVERENAPSRAHVSPVEIYAAACGVYDLALRARTADTRE